MGSKEQPCFSDYPIRQVGMLGPGKCHTDQHKYSVKERVEYRENV